MRNNINGYLILLILIFLRISSYSQLIIDKQTCVEGSAYGLTKALQLKNQNYLIAVYTYSTDTTQGAKGKYDIKLEMLDSNQNALWTRNYGGSQDEWPCNIFNLSNNTFMVIGVTESSDKDIANNKGGRDVWAFVIDSVGNLLGERTFGGSKNDEPVRAGMLANGNVFIHATTESTNGDIPTHIFDKVDWEFSIDETLTSILHSNVLNISEDYYNFCMSLTTDSNYVVRTYEKENQPEDHFFLCYVRKNDFSGTSFSAYLGANFFTSQIITCPNGNYIVMGVTYPNGMDQSGPPWGEAKITMFNKNLVPIWSKTLNGSGWDSFETGLAINDNVIWIVGKSMSMDGDYENLQLNGNHFLMKFDSLGNIFEKKSIINTECVYRINNITQNDAQPFLLSGYTVESTYNSCSCDSYDGWIGSFDEKVNTIKGKMFLDENSNNILDSSEHKITLPALYVNQSIPIKNNSGDYEFTTSAPGQYITTTDSTPYYNSSPTSYTTIFQTDSGADSLNDFALQPAGVYNDASIKLTLLSAIRNSAKTIFRLDCKNVGTQTINTIISFTDSSIFNFTYYDATLAPDSIVGNTVFWSIDSITPLNSSHFYFSFLSGSVGSGALLNCKTNCTIGTVDDDTTNNSTNNDYYTVASYDPNNISVNFDTVYTNKNSGYPYLEYTIHFQNEGTDTAFNIAIENYLNYRALDFNTLEIIETSHPVKLSLYSAYGMIYFNFENINLLTKTQNELLSIGYIKYRIKIKDNVLVPSTINNNAGIYFDLNDPIYTNQALTEIILNCEINPDSIYTVNNQYSICKGTTITLHQKGGATINGNHFAWYQDSCKAILLGYGDSITVTPLENTTYFVHVTDSCNNGPCASRTIIVSDPPSVSLIAPNGNITCADSLILIFNSNQPGKYKWFQDYQFMHGSINDTLTVNKTGMYTIKFENDSGCSVAVNKKMNLNKPKLELGNDGEQCSGYKLSNIGPIFQNYLWNTGSVSSSINIFNSGTYTVTVTNFGCTSSNSISIVVVPKPIVNLGPDSTYCTPVVLDAQNTGSTYQWNTNQYTQTIIAGWSYNYKVMVTDTNGCKNSDAIQINIEEIYLNLGKDDTICGSKLLDAYNDNSLYLWSDGSTNYFFYASQSGTYSVTVTNAFGCVKMDTVNIVVLQAPSIFLGNDTTFCGTMLELDAQVAAASYLWNTGSTTQKCIVYNSGSFYVNVTYSNGCKVSDAINVSMGSAIQVELGNDTTFCANSILLDAQNPGSSYLWSDGTTLKTLLATKTGIYSVQVTSPFTCIANDTISVTNLQSIINLGTDKTICDSLLLDAQNPGSTFLWNDGSSNQTLMVYATGAYIVTVTNSSFCENSDTINITLASHPTVNFANDTTFCGNGILNANNTGCVYLWNGGQTTQNIFVDTAGTYSVLVINADGCTASDSIVVSINPLPQISFNAFVKDTICRQAGILNINAATPVGGVYYLNNTVYSAASIDPSTLPLGINVLAYQYTDGLGCKDSATNHFWVDDCTAINSIAEISHVKLIPNPVSDNLTINTKLSNYEIKIFSAKGELVFEKSNCKNDTKVITKTYDAGLYNLQIITKAGIKIMKVAVVNK